MTTTYADAFGVHHALDCQHPERIAHDGDGWRCNGCGQQSATARTTTTKENNQ